VRNGVYPTERNIKVRNCTFDGRDRVDFAFNDPDGTGSIKFSDNTTSRPVKISGSLDNIAIKGDTSVATSSSHE